MSKLAERIARRLKAEFGIEVEPVINRNYLNWQERTEGCSSWFMFFKDSDILTIGSQFPATELVKAKKWEVSEVYNDLTIDPVNEKL